LLFCFFFLVAFLLLFPILLLPELMPLIKYNYCTHISQLVFSSPETLIGVPCAYVADPPYHAESTGLYFFWLLSGTSLHVLDAFCSVENEEIRVFLPWCQIGWKSTLKVNS
jgi:hypothetical protein